MRLFIVVPVIMGIAIVSVVGIRALYNHTAGKGEGDNRIDAFTKTVEERTRDLAGDGN